MGKGLETGRTETSPGPGYLYCATCRKQVGLTYSPNATMASLQIEAQLAVYGQGDCVDPKRPHQGPFVTRDQLPPVAPPPAQTG